jgi:hypothetical protein
VNGLQGALEFHRTAQLLQGQVGLPGQQRTQLALVSGDNHGLAPGTMMARRYVAGASPLLQEFLHHAQGHPEAVGHLGASAFTLIVGRKDSLPEIER